MQARLDDVLEEQRTIGPVSVQDDAAPAQRIRDLNREMTRLDNTLDELAELDLMVDGYVPDPLNPRSIEYDPKLAERIVMTLLLRTGATADEIDWLYRVGWITGLVCQQKQLTAVWLWIAV